MSDDIRKNIKVLDLIGLIPYETKFMDKNHNILENIEDLLDWDVVKFIPSNYHNLYVVIKKDKLTDTVIIENK